MTSSINLIKLITSTKAMTNIFLKIKTCTHDKKYVATLILNFKFVSYYMYLCQKDYAIW